MQNSYYGQYLKLSKAPRDLSNIVLNVCIFLVMHP